MRDPLLSSHFWSLAGEMQFYALAPFLAALGWRSVWTFALVVLAAGAVMSRPWGGFWWTFRPDALAVGVLLGVETRWGAAWIDRVPKIGIGLATYWLLAAAIFARVTSATGSGVGLVVVAAIFGMVVAWKADGEDVLEQVRREVGMFLTKSNGRAAARLSPARDCKRPIY